MAIGELSISIQASKSTQQCSEFFHEVCVVVADIAHGQKDVFRDGHTGQTLARRSTAPFGSESGALLDGLQQGLQPGGIRSSSAWQSALTCLAFTWLNPHVYLDTVVLLGSVSTQFKENITWFAAGAMSASFVFFFALGYGARLLRPVFAQARAWRILDFLIGCIMWGIALKLVFMT